MKLSNILFTTFFVWFLLANINKTVLGPGYVVLYLLLIALGYYLTDRLVRYFELLENKSSCSSAPDVARNILQVNRDEEFEQCSACLICNELDCGKHDAELKVYLQPWKSLLINGEINAALEDFINFVIDKYTSSWLTNIFFKTEEVLNEFRKLIRYLCSSMLLRTHQKMSLNEFLLQRVPKYLINHLEIYVTGKRKAKLARLVEHSVIAEYGKHIHPALIDAESEAKYLKMVAHLINQTSFPPRFLKCDVSSCFLNEFVAFGLLSPLIELLSDPDNINILLIYLFKKDDKVVDNIPPTISNKVELLRGFSATNASGAPACSPLGIELKQILDDPHLLFLFTNYSKEEHFTNHLQFKLQMDSFLTRLTSPEFTDSQLQDLREELTKICENYFDRKSGDYIEFDPQIVANLTAFVETEDLRQLQNSRSLYDAIEYVQDILNQYCYKFFSTDIYLKLICGQRSMSFNMGDSTCDKDNMEGIDGQSYELEESLEMDDKIAHHFRVKDLTGWSTSIHQVVAKLDENGRECFLFQINVNKQDEQQNFHQDWTVERQFNEFYVLESKLKEFHGAELESVCLPPKKTFQRVTISLMESYVLDFERFLNRLLLKSNLRRSELIYNFLCLNDFNVNLADNFFLSRMIKNVPSKFAKERGQHLYSFLRNFINSCEKKSTLCLPSETAKQRSSLSGYLNPLEQQPVADLKNRMHAHLEYIYDFIILVLVRFYNTNNWFLQLLYMLRPIGRLTLQNICEKWLADKFRDDIFTPNKLIYFISLLKQIISDETPRNDDQEEEEEEESNQQQQQQPSKNQRSQRALKLLSEFVPPWAVARLLDQDKHEENIFLLFSVLQHRLLNKQLLYLLLDSIVSDLFPPAVCQHVEMDT